MSAVILNVREAARYLRIHPITLYKLSRARRVPVQKVGGSWRFHREALDQWMRTGGQLPIHEDHASSTSRAIAIPTRTPSSSTTATATTRHATNNA